MLPLSEALRKLQNLKEEELENASQLFSAAQFEHQRVMDYLKVNFPEGRN
jgi:hypothetical protein